VIGWVDASSGASGDMLLGALVGAGVPVGVVADAVEKVAPEHVAIVPERVARNGFAATRCHVEVADSVTHRTWADVRTLLAEAGLHEDVRVRAHDTFDRLAVAEAAVHGTDPDDVHFHEVGALDAIADVVGVSAGLVHLGLDRLVVSPVAVGSGSVRGAHGSMPVPPPAVAELLRGVPSYAGPETAPRLELCTPTGAALLVAHATAYGPQPAMTVTSIGVGAGSRDPAGHANVLRLLVGEEISTGSITGGAGSSGEAIEGGGGALVIETNVDDLDPRLWPGVLSTLLEAGASDAWLTPILMKKGRPAHTLHALVSAERADAVRRAIFRHTSTIGVREVRIGKSALDREMRTVQVDGHDIAVKLARLDDEVVNAQPEYEDVARVASATGRPVKDVLAAAVAATREHVWT
jgi:pyridinium-3,5-bisthiocarboxylic acid mononucleotide nickel chelatase